MNKHSLNQLKLLVEFLGEVLGPDYEIVLHDLTNEKNCVIAIANGHISGRTVGSPITDRALSLLSDTENKDKNYLANYKGVTKSNQILRSSTMVFKDEKKEPYALLCINFDDSRFIELHDKVLSIAHPLSFLKKYSEHTLQNMTSAEDTDETTMTEQLAPDIDVLMNQIYSGVMLSVGIPEGRLNQDERIEIIRLLNAQGFFKLKGAVSYLSHKFECSIASIYRYLNEAKY